METDPILLSLQSPSLPIFHSFRIEATKRKKKTAASSRNEVLRNLHSLPYFFYDTFIS